MALCVHPRIWLAVLVAATFALPADADEPLAAYLAGTCATCHRVDASDSAMPALAGRDAAELIAALRDYRSGVREDALMRAVANSLSDAETSEVAAHLAALEPPK